MKLFYSLLILVTLNHRVISIVSGSPSWNSFCQNCFRPLRGIIREVQKQQGFGQIIISQDSFQNLLQNHDKYPEEELVGEIPWLVYGGQKSRFTKSYNGTSKSRQLITYKFTSFKFAHLNDLTLAVEGREEHFFSWRTRLYLGFKYGFVEIQRNFKSKVFPLKSFLHQDLFIFTFDQLHLTSYNFTLFNWGNFKHSIWLGCPKNFSLFQNYSNGNVTVPVFFQNGLTCVFSSEKSRNLLHNVPSCEKGVIAEVHDFYQRVLGNHSAGKSVLCKAKKYCNYDQEPINNSSIFSLTKKIVGDPFARKSFLYSSLVFIVKRMPENGTNVWGPFTVASWIGILAAYTVTAIAFGIIKIITMNNLDNSWYECIISQLLSFMTEDRAFLQKEMTSIGNTTVGIIFDDNDNVDFGGTTYRCEWRADNGTFVGARRVSVRSLGVQIPVENIDSKNDTSLTGNLARGSRHQQNHGKISKVILYGTIRVISFILLAMYEGKLYNTITFPANANPVESFDQLISSEKYFVKLSNEAIKHENITEKIRGNISTSNFVGSFTNKSRTKFVESVNILDCVNWVESGDANHACVGYEFELRNLHKAQKSDKILVKSKQRLLRFGTSASARFSRRRGFTMFPGGFQISKWILESGILQLWSIVENAFMESFINPNWNDPFKVFTIRDYLGLFVIYSLLLILASIMFLLEHTVVIGKKVMRNSKVKKAWRSVSKFGSNLKRILCCKNGKPTCLSTHFEGKLIAKWRNRKYLRALSSMNPNSVRSSV